MAEKDLSKEKLWVAVADRAISYSLTAEILVNYSTDPSIQRRFIYCLCRQSCATKRHEEALTRMKKLYPDSNANVSRKDGSNWWRIWRTSQKRALALDVNATIDALNHGGSLKASSLAFADLDVEAGQLRQTKIETAIQQLRAVLAGRLPSEERAMINITHDLLVALVTI